MQSKTSPRSRKKQKVDKSKGTLPMVLTDGELNEIGDKVKEATMESWRKIEDHYSALLRSVEKSIIELKILEQTSRKLVNIGQTIHPERLMEMTFGMRIMQIM